MDAWTRQEQETGLENAGSENMGLEDAGLEEPEEEEPDYRTCKIPIPFSKSTSSFT